MLVLTSPMCAILINIHTNGYHLYATTIATAAKVSLIHSTHTHTHTPISVTIYLYH